MRDSRLILIPLCASLASLVFAASAMASDTFTMHNYSTYPLDSSVGGSACATGAFAVEGGAQVEAGETATVTLERSGFSCDPSFSTSGGTSFGGSWYFEPDDPAIGEASLECGIEGEAAEWIEITKSELTCTARDIENSLGVSASAGGSVECSADGKAFGSCSSSYDHGTYLEMRAVPDHGEYFKGFVGSGSASECAAQCRFSITQGSSVVASFGPTHPLTVAKSGHGTVKSVPDGIDCSQTSCTAEFDDETTVALTATPATGYEFAGWIGCPGAESSCEVTIDGATEVKAIFLKAGAAGEKGERGRKGANPANRANPAKGANEAKRANPAKRAKSAKRAKRAEEARPVNRARPANRGRPVNGARLANRGRQVKGARRVNGA